MENDPYLTYEREFELNKTAVKLRMEIVKEIGHLGVGHVGGSMSIVDILTVLYWEVMDIRPENPKWEQRDRLIVSKGHAGPALYAALAMKGFFPKEMLMTLNQPGTSLPSHCDRLKTPGIDMTTGSLGQGISSAAGIALACRMKGLNNYVYSIIGDGECNEGQVWEAALFAAHRKLSNFIVFADYNHQCLDGRTEDICDLGDLDKKFKEFNWYTQSVAGHDIRSLYNAINNAKAQTEKPSMIVMNTIKGRGVKDWEGSPSNHNISLTKESTQAALEELRFALQRLPEVKPCQ